MGTKTKELCENIITIIGEYSDCASCGRVIKDSSLLLPDPLNPGRYRSTCPNCGKETMMCPFPPNELKPVFEMIVESAERNRPILVLILSCTAYEALVEGLFCRLLERRFTYPEVSEAIIEATEYRSKMRIIHCITGKNAKNLVKSAGYNKLIGTLDNIKAKRNCFLHTGIAMKVETEEHNVGDLKFSFPRTKKLDENDVNQALQFTIDAVDCFSKLFSDYGKFIYIDEPV